MVTGGTKLRNFAQYARDAADAGFAGMVIAETGRTAYLSAAVAAIEDLDLDLATGVALAFPRSPMITAATAWELAQASGGRFRLGLGTQVRAHIERRYATEFDHPGPRLRDYVEAVRACFAAFRGERLDHHGEFYDLVLDPPRVASDAAQARGGTAPPFYFGGMSDPARDTAAEHADVFLMWPDTMDGVQSTISDMRARADAHGRSLRFGYRVHVVVRETEDAARAAAFDLVSRLEPEVGAAVRQRSLDASSVGVARQTDLRDRADADGYVEANLWTGIGRARSGCGAAIVGDPDQVVAKLREYEALGIDSFILSGYPHREECELVGRHVLPAIRGRTT